MALTYRWIQGDELSRLDKIFKLRGWTPLDKDTSDAIAVFDGDELVGFHVVQVRVHAEPQYLDKRYRGKGIANEMAAKVIERLPKDMGIFVIADDPTAAVLCERHGLKRITSPVFVR